MAIQNQPLRRPCLTRYSLPCVLMRAGTSKGIFVHRKDLPKHEVEWASHFISALGSRNNDAKQVDGVGGGSSTTSKVAVISPSSRPDVDVDFTFVQVAVGKESVDFSGNCGNMSSGVGPFAVQEGLVTPQNGQREIAVRIFNTNTSRTIVETISLNEEGEYVEDGDFFISGVKAPGSEVKCSFVDPAGSMAGTLFPTGHKQQWLRVDPASLSRGCSPFQVRVTLIDAANPFVLVSSASILPILGSSHSTETKHALVESIRRQGAVAMGLAPDAEAAGKVRGTPKIAILEPPSSCNGSEEKHPDIYVQSYSMGLPHPTLQLTGAVCLGAAISITGTIAADISAMASSELREAHLLLTPERTPSPDTKVGEEEDYYVKNILIEHSKGNIPVTVVTQGSDDIVSCTVSRTARRLFEGKVIYYL